MMDPRNAGEILSILKKALSEAYGPDPPPRDSFRTLIGCILSQRTRDANTETASRKLFSVVDSPKAILALPEEELKTLIRSAGFYNQKARHIRGTCEALVRMHDGRVPSDRNRLLELPGVGPKTADIVLCFGFNEPAIPVDVHVRRVSIRLGLAPQKASPVKVKERLEGTYPPGEWRFIDKAFLEVGKKYCRAGKPRCAECPLGGLCQRIGVT